MTRSPLRFRDATVDDSAILAELVDMAGKGMPTHLWSRMATLGETPLDVGRRRAMRDSGTFSWRNTIVAEHEARVVACVVGYRLPDPAQPIDHASMPAMLVPFQELENLAPGTWYINVLAVRPQFRRQGLGTRLLDLAGKTARALGRRGTSVIVSDANTGARRLYERCGYSVCAGRRMIKDDWENHGQNWILLAKDL